MEQRKTGNEAIIFAQDAAVKDLALKDLAQTEAWLYPILTVRIKPTPPPPKMIGTKENKRQQNTC